MLLFIIHNNRLFANEASAQRLQNAVLNECHTKFLTKLWPGCMGKSDTNNLPAPADLTENPYGGKNFFSTMQLKNRPRWFYA
jgi:hypothetical protein